MDHSLEDAFGPDPAVNAPSSVRSLTLDRVEVRAGDPVEFRQYLRAATNATGSTACCPGEFVEQSAPREQAVVVRQAFEAVLVRARAPAAGRAECGGVVLDLAHVPRARS